MKNFKTEAEQKAYEQGRNDKAEELIAYVRTEEFMRSWVNCPIGTRFGEFVAKKFKEGKENK